jgi:exonuclease VII large subunit
VATSRYSRLPEDQKERSRKRCSQYSKDHRQELNEWARKYRKDNPEWTRDTQKRARKKLKENSPERMIWKENRKRARARGIQFNLEPSDIVIPKVCPILGIELSFGVGRVHEASPSLDRIIPSLGYVKGNCFIISSKANRMKQDNTIEDFMKILKYIQDRLPK